MLEHLRQRPEAHSFLVWEAPTPHHAPRRDAGDLAGFRGAGDVGGEPALADPSRSDDGDQVRPTLVGGSPQQHAHQLQLVAAADQQGRDPRALRPGLPQRAMHGDRLGHALQSHVPESLEIEHMPGVPIRPFAHHHRAGRSYGLESRGDGGRLTGDPGLMCLAVRGKHFACMDRDPHRELPTHRVGEERSEFAKGRLHLEAGPHGAHRIVLMRQRHPEHADDRVADELLDGSPEPRDRSGHGLEERGVDTTQLLRIEPRREFRRGFQVSEEDGHDLSLFQPERRRFHDRVQPRPTGVAEHR
jgi:hypothetical protein